MPVMEFDRTMDTTDLPSLVMPAMHIDTVVGATDLPATTTPATATPTATPATAMPAADLDTIMDGDNHETTQDNVGARPTGIVPQQAPRDSLMRLPTEIRPMIFKELLQMAHPILFKGRYSGVYLGRPAPYSIIRNPPKLSESYQRPDKSITIKQKDILNIFVVSKTICIETVPLYYPKNTFVFDSLDVFASFADKMSYYDESTDELIAQGKMTIEDRRTANIKTITSLDIEWQGEAPARAAEKLLKFEGLRKLTIHIDTSSVARVTKDKPYEPKLYGMQHLLKIRGLSELQLNFPAYLGCRHKDSPNEVKNGLCNLAEGESRAAFERTLEVLKQEKNITNRNKLGGPKAKKVQGVAKEMDQKA